MADIEYAVVGGGIAGVSIAYHLSEVTDASIRLYERQSIASETTYKSLAWFGLYGNETYYRMKQYGMELYNEFFETPRANSKYRLTGLLDVATSEETATHFERSLAGDLPKDERSYAAKGAERDHVAYLDGDEIRRSVVVPGVETDAVAGAIYRPRVGYIPPHELAFEFLERAADNGVEIVQNTRVEQVTVDDGRVTGLDAGGEHVAVDDVICAAGPWNVEMLESVGLELPIKHTLAPVMVLDPPNPVDSTLPSMSHAETGVSFRKNDDGSVYVSHYPGDYHSAGTRLDPDTESDSVPTEFRDTAIDVIDRLWPFLSDAKLVEQWVGVRSVTADGNPIIGETSLDGLSLAAFNTSGIQLAPAAGRLIAHQLTGRDLPGYFRDVSPARFDGESTD